MLNEWTIGNFKSLAETESLELAPLTLICGPNNSGKSTIMQSVLAMGQTFSATSHIRALVLNGRFTRLGRFADLLHAGNRRNAEMKIGFTLGIPWDSRIEKVTLGVVSVAPDEERKSRRGLPIAKEYEMDIWWGSDDGRGKHSVLDLKYEKHSIYPEFEYTIDSEKAIETEFALTGDVRPTHLSLSGLAPTGMLMEFNVASRRAAEDFERLIAILTDTDASALTQSVLAEPIRRDSPIWDLLYAIRRRERRLLVKPELDDLLGTASRQPMTWKDLQDEIQRGGSIELDHRGQPQEFPRWSSKGKSDLRGRLLDWKDEWLHEIEQKKPTTGYQPRPLPDQLQTAVTQLKDFWTERFSYLGPLRDDPKVIFAAPTDIERRSVGTKGEFTAAVLTEWGDKEIEYPLPPGKDDGATMKSSKGPLAEAVRTWLQYMGLVDGVSTRELAKIGYELTVRSSGLNKPLDLMNVGVGVSQILPTLVMTLIAPEGSTLILEQPELHLHPGVQSILGDFLLGMADLGKQCLVETHSEHLVNRVRRRIAEAPEDSVMKLVRIYFAEKPDLATKIIPVKPNEYGAIPDWPEGFFDEAADETEMIIEAATRKRNRKLERKREGLRDGGGSSE